MSQSHRFVLFQVGSEGRAESALRKLVRLLVSPLQLAWVILYERANVVHINTAMDTKAFWRDIWYLAMCRILSRKVVFQIHGGALPQDFFAGNRALTWLLRHALSAATVLVLLSRTEQTAYQHFVPKSRVELIPNAIDTDGLLAGDVEKSALEPALHLAFLGRLIPSKGVPEVIEATRLLRDRGVPVRLSIAGSGPSEASFRQSVDDAGLADIVTFRGALFGEDKVALWRAAHLFVFPTYHKEGLPYTLLESMAAATVPLICPVAAIPDVMEDGVHGIFVSPHKPQALAEVIQRLSGDRASIVRMARAGRTRVCESYTIDRLARDFTALYTSLI